MRKLLILLAACIVLIISIAGAAAQDAAPDTMMGHPIVGQWLLDTDADDPENAPEVIRFSADGGYVSVDAEGTTTLGVWEATGERTAVLNIVGTGVEDGAYAGMFVIRATVEVDAAGDTFTAQYTAESIMPDGSATGEYGPATATATRITVEPMGTPVGPLSDLFGDEGTPEATPES